jgi:hypothetical protein
MNLADLFQSQLEETPAQVTVPESVPNSAESALAPLAPTAPTVDSLADKPVEIVLTLLPGAPFSTRRIKGAVSIAGSPPLFLTEDAVAASMMTVLERYYTTHLQQQAEAIDSAESMQSDAEANAADGDSVIATTEVTEPQEEQSSDAPSTLSIF